MQIFEKLSLKIKIQIIMFSSIVIILFTTLISIYCINKANNEVLYNTLFSSLTYSSKELKKELTSVETIVDIIFSNNSIQDNLYNYKNSSITSHEIAIQAELYQLLNKFIFSDISNIINFISIYQDEKVVTTSRALSNALSDEVIITLILKAKAAKGTTVWVNDFCEKEGLFVVKEIRRIKNLGLDSIGVLILNIDISKLVESTAIYNTNYEDISYLLMDNDIIMYESNNLSENSDNKFNYNIIEDYQIISKGNKKYFAVKGNIEDFDWNYISIVAYDSIVRASKLALELAIIAIGISIILVVILSSRLVNTLAQHFQCLVYKMKCFGEGNYEKVVTKYEYSKNQDEISLLHINFDKMVEKVNTLIKDNYISEIQKKQFRIEVLESQIDPHFLYNTLEIINWRARSIGALNISDMTMALGNILRIILNKDEGKFTLNMELSALDYFITIQKLRYNDRINYEINIMDNTIDCEIPKLTLQPLVENAILYGLEEGEEVLKIIIDARKIEDRLIIEVKNTGSNFQEDLLTKLDSGEIKPHGFGIGLLNIHKRIGMIYGADFGLTLYNSEDENYEELAVTRVVLPFRT